MLKWILPLLVLITFEGIADIFSKEWSLKGGHLLWIGALTSYMIANTFWLFALKNGSGLIRGATLFFVASAIIATVIGFYLYKEELGLFQMFGIALGMVSIALMFWE